MNKLIVVMGVSGTGKSTVAKALAKELGCPFIEADDFHSEQAKQQMANGIPLTDQQRIPWMKRLCKEASDVLSLGKSVVLCCSCLRKRQRDMFRNLNSDLTFVFLQGEPDLIKQRMEQRGNHFFSADMLESQLAALEVPENERDVIAMDVKLTPETITEQSLALMTNKN